MRSIVVLERKESELLPHFEIRLTEHLELELQKKGERDALCHSAERKKSKLLPNFEIRVTEYSELELQMKGERDALCHRA